MAKCPMCGHQWTYRQKLLGYALKPRTRIKCPDCKEYIEPATVSIIFDYVAVIVLALLVFIVIPFMHLPVATSVLFTGVLIALYIFLFIPLTVKFKKYDYNMKTPG
ncbi:TIGR04104 family putative zinc finger protein [Lacicoccus qingdaonensis]|uniref:TIGR04104 family putative zinc finger protein n=1 Tax=Lacicoccus qingdaonensis TaxID=576118 RepID=UPI000A8E7C03|nr:TIGR04104 family putative zinc finger protein [Salinicoccus qingdaonensis]